MNYKHFKIRAVSMILICFFILSSFQAKSQGILTIKLDSTFFLHQDEFIYCPVYDSILVLPLDESTFPSWITFMGDSINSDSLYIPNGYDTDIFYDDIIGEMRISFPIMIRVGTELSSEQNLTITCDNNSIELNASNSFVANGNISYNWTPAEGLDDATIQNPTATVSDDIVYTAIISSSNGCTETQTHTIALDTQLTPEICIIGINEDNKNLIHFDKSSSIDIDSFYILKETFVADQYEKIGVVEYESENIFVDYSSNPNIQSNKYKIQVRDNCGRISEMSPAHKTIHLSINQGQDNVWNLIWEPYEGFAVSTYFIYRGTNPDEMELIGTSSSSNTQYSDFSAPNEYIYYQIEIVIANTCGTKKVSIGDGSLSSKSNIATNNSNPYSISDYTRENVFTIFPNPSNDKLNIKLLKNSFSGFRYQITTITGQTLIENRLLSEFEVIDISKLESGIYLLSLRSRSGFYEHKTFIKK